MLLELFSGSGRLSAAARLDGWDALEVDILRGIDLADSATQRVLLSFLASHRGGAVWLAPPCSSWSSARRGVPGSAGGPLRTVAAIWGLPCGRPQDALAVRDGNRTMQAAIAIIKLCAKMGIPAVLENPSSALTWQIPGMRRIAELPCASSHLVDFCGYGAPWRKRTRLLCVHVPDAFVCPQRCSGRGVCSFTHVPHMRLEGQANGVLRTKLAEPYPMPFAAAMSMMLRRAMFAGVEGKFCQ